MLIVFKCEDFGVMKTIYLFLQGLMLTFLPFLSASSDFYVYEVPKDTIFSRFQYAIVVLIFKPHSTKHIVSVTKY